MMLVAREGAAGSVESFESVSFSSIGVWERSHLQEWIRKNPVALGEDLLIMSVEFSQFNGSKDRLDLLAIDKDGNLVVAELKRDAYAGYADLQSIRYAAMVSTMTMEKLASHFSQYRRKQLNELEVDDGSSLNLILEFIENDDFSDLNDKPRIILCSENFSQEVTTTVLWLNTMELNITCVRIVPYQVDGMVIVVPTTIIPLPEAREYMVSVREKREEQRSNSATKRKTPTMTVLLAEDILKPGDQIYLLKNLPDYVNYDSDDPMFHATVTGKKGSKSIQWNADGKEYSLSGLTRQIFNTLNPDSTLITAIHGQIHWTRDQIQTLWDEAEAVRNNKVENI